MLRTYSIGENILSKYLVQSLAYHVDALVTRLFCSHDLFQWLY